MTRILLVLKDIHKIDTQTISIAHATDEAHPISIQFAQNFTLIIEHSSIEV